MLMAVSILSPVSTQTLMPAADSAAIDSGTPSCDQHCMHMVSGCLLQYARMINTFSKSNHSVKSAHTCASLWSTHLHTQLWSTHISDWSAQHIPVGCNSYLHGVILPGWETKMCSQYQDMCTQRFATHTHTCSLSSTAVAPSRVSPVSSSSHTSATLSALFVLEVQADL